MRIDKLRIKGITRFDKEIALDFTSLPPGIIAIVGGNGEGKSTLMETMALGGFYRRMVRGELLDCVTARDAYIDVEAAFDGRGSYRARVNLDQVARKSDAVLEHLADGSRQMLNDGKASTFDRVVARDFPSYEQILCSAYAAQNQEGSFGSLSIKGRRDVFGKMLGHDHYVKYCETSREAARATDRRRGELKMLVDRLAAETTPEQGDRLKWTESRLRSDISKATFAVDHAQKLVAEYERRREGQAVLADAHRRAKDALDAAKQRKEDLVQQLRTIETDAAAAARDLERRTSDIEAAMTRVIDREAVLLGTFPSAHAIEQQLQKRITEIDARLATAVSDRKDRIANNQQLILQATEIRAAAALAKDLREQLQLADAALDAALLAESNARASVHAITVERAGLMPIVDERARILETTALLERVPCGGQGEYAGCELLQTARTAKNRLPELDAKIEQLNVLGQRLAAATETHDVAKAATAEAKKTKDAITARLTTKLIEDANDLPHLEAAEKRIEELQAEIVTLEREAEQDRAAARQAAVDENAKRDREIEASADRVKAERAKTDAALTLIRHETEQSGQAFDAKRQPIEVALAAVATEITVADGKVRETAPAFDALATIDNELTAARQRHATETAAAARLDAELAAHLPRVAEFQARVEERDRLAGALKTLDADLVDWQALARIFGPEGLPVLEIDQAGPGVSAIANDLLQSCFGGRFTVELITQEAKADGKGMKEVFELRVFDGERGGEPRDLALVSGGEAVLIEEALRSAIAMYVNQRNVLPIRTVWRDETTGALSPENAPRYVAMLRRIRERGGIHHLFFITHNPDAAAMADAQLVVGGGKAEIVLPPFSRVA